MHRFDSIEQIVLQHSTRNMDKIQHHYHEHHTHKAVEAFLNCPKGTVFIYTGFYVAGFAETDGPVGAYFIARALDELGYEPIIITDSFCEGYFHDIQTLYIPLAGLCMEAYHALLDSHRPVAHIAIERLGQNRDGKYLNSRGDDIKEFTAPLDVLFSLGKEFGALTIGIGDGGNEVGMGSFKEALENKEYFPDYCIIECDYPIIASVSNWGGYGWIAELEKILHVELLPDFEEVDSYLNYIVARGSVDGIKRESVKSVDGKAWELEKEILTALKAYIKG